MGSAPDAVRIREVNCPHSWHLVALNNAWRLRDDAAFWLAPGDFPVANEPPAEYPARRVRAAGYMPALRRAGGILFSGATMAFCGGYFALGLGSPSVVGFLGCDMVYRDENSHFYGKGRADPLIDSPATRPSVRDLLAKSVRLWCWGALNNSLLVNCSGVEGSQLVMPLMPDRAAEAWQAVLRDDGLDPILAAATAQFQRERRFPVDRFTMNLHPISADAALMAEIGRIDVGWRQIGQELAAFLANQGLQLPEGVTEALAAKPPWDERASKVDSP